MSILKRLLSVECPDCGTSNGVVWRYLNKPSGGAQNGRLSTHEIQTEFYAGCEYCSETLAIVPVEKMLAQINDLKNSGGE